MSAGDSLTNAQQALVGATPVATFDATVRVTASSATRGRFGGGGLGGGGGGTGGRSV